MTACPRIRLRQSIFVHCLDKTNYDRLTFVLVLVNADVTYSRAFPDAHKTVTVHLRRPRNRFYDGQPSGKYLIPRALRNTMRISTDKPELLFAKLMHSACSNSNDTIRMDSYRSFSSEHFAELMSTIAWKSEEIFLDRVCGGFFSMFFYAFIFIKTILLSYRVMRLVNELRTFLYAAMSRQSRRAAV